MPHIDIRHFPIPLNEDQKIDHASNPPAITASVFGVCSSEAVTIAVEAAVPFPADCAATQPARSGASR